MWGAIYNLLLGDSTPEQRTTVWRIAITLAFIVHVMVVYGAVPGIKTGFASKDGLAELQESVRDIQLTLLLDSIDHERRNACAHQYSHNDQALSYAVRKRDDLIREYKRLTGDNVPAVSCQELGVGVSEAVACSDGVSC